MLHAAETWIVTVSILNRLKGNDLAIIRWMCNVKANYNIHSDSLFSKLGIQNVEVVLYNSRIRWFGHVERSTGWISQMQKLELDSCKKPAKPKKTWNQLILNDKKKLGMICANPIKRSEWKGRLRDRCFKKPNP